MDMNQLDVARELHRDRERMVAESFRTAGQGAALGPAPRLPRSVVSALESLARLVGHRARLAH